MILIRKPHHVFMFTIDWKFYGIGLVWIYEGPSAEPTIKHTFELLFFCIKTWLVIYKNE